jgi:hypothetical protein
MLSHKPTTKEINSTTISPGNYKLATESQEDLEVVVVLRIFDFMAQIFRSFDQIHRLKYVTRMSDAMPGSIPAELPRRFQFLYCLLIIDVIFKNGSRRITVILMLILMFQISMFNFFFLRHHHFVLRESSCKLHLSESLF